MDASPTALSPSVPTGDTAPSAKRATAPSPDAASRSGRGPVAVVLALVAFAIGGGAFAWSWSRCDDFTCIDYYTVWVAADAARTGASDDIYDADDRHDLAALYKQRAFAAVGPDRAVQVKSKRLHAAHIVDAVYAYGPPWLYAACGLIAGGDYDRDQLYFQRYSLVVLALGALCLCAMLRFGALASGIAVAVLLLGFAPVESDLWVGNVNRVLFGGVALFLWIGAGDDSRWRDFVGGAVLGLTAMFKPNVAAIPVVLGIGWLATGQLARLGRLVAGMTGGSLLAFLASSLYFGSTSVWWSWGRAFYGLMGPKPVKTSTGNIGPRGMADRVGLPEWVESLLASKLLPVLLLAVIAAAVWLGGRCWRRSAGDRRADDDALRRRDVLLAGLGATLMLLSAPLAWVHYFVAIVPLGLYLLRPSAERTGAARWALRSLAAAGVLLVAYKPLAPILGSESGTLEQSVVAGAWLLLVAGLVEAALPASGESTSVERT